MIEHTFDLEHVETELGGVTPITKVKVEIGTQCVTVGFDGFGCCNMETGLCGQVVLEIKNGVPRVIVFGDINQEDPTHIIELSWAKESLRNEPVKLVQCQNDCACHSCSFPMYEGDAGFSVPDTDGSLAWYCSSCAPRKPVAKITKLQATRLYCCACGRKFDLTPDDADLYPGGPCPSDDCPSHHEELCKPDPTR